MQFKKSALIKIFWATLYQHKGPITGPTDVATKSTFLNSKPLGYPLPDKTIPLQSPGAIPKKFLPGCAAPVFDRITLAKDILVENIPLAKENFLIMIPILHDFKEFQPKYSLFKRIFPKTDVNLAPKCQFLGVFVKNIPLAKDFGRKIYPGLRNFCQKYTLG